MIWVTSFSGFLFPALTYNLAVVPRDPMQWWGVITHVLVHKDLAHLLANSAPLVIFLLLLQAKGSKHFFSALGVSLFIGGILLWSFGRAGAHIGASGLVFALFGLHVANGFFARGLTDILIALAVLAGYWGLVFGFLPTDTLISWDGHVFGAIGGIVASWALAKWDSESPNEL